MALPLRIEEPTGSSALATARLRRRWSIADAARRSGLGAEQVGWLEEGRLYRFPTSDDALAAAVVYAAALEVELAEARRPPPPAAVKGPRRRPKGGRRHQLVAPRRKPGRRAGLPPRPRRPSQA